jgi:hypothetical protein
MNSELQEARTRSAGPTGHLVDVARRVRAEIGRYETVVRDAHELYRLRTREMALAIREGGDIPADIGAQRLALDAQQREAQAAYDFLLTVENEVKAQIDQHRSSNVDLALSYLDTRVGEIVAQAAALVSVLGGARTPEQVLAAGPGAAQAWNDLGDLGQVYGDVRHAQQVLVSESWGTVDVITQPAVPLQQSGILRDVAAVWPGWADSDRGSTGARAPWPHHDPSNPYVVTHDRAYLIWAVDADAQLWVPGLEELHQAAQAFDAATTAAMFRRASANAAAEAPLYVGSLAADMHVQVAI